MIKCVDWDNVLVLDLITSGVIYVRLWPCTVPANNLSTAAFTSPIVAIRAEIIKCELTPKLEQF